MWKKLKNIKTFFLTKIVLSSGENLDIERSDETNGSTIMCLFFYNFIWISVFTHNMYLENCLNLLYPYMCLDSGKKYCILSVDILFKT